MNTTTRKKFSARLLLRQPIYDKQRNLVDYQWDSCQIEFTSKLPYPSVAGAEMLCVLEEVITPVKLPSAILEKPIDELNLSVRAKNCLLTAGIRTVAALVERHPVDLAKCKGVGNTMLHEYAAALKKLGIKWGGARWQP